eukprot:6187516-Pleurochrysis_carterae.AAC.3
MSAACDESTLKLRERCVSLRAEKPRRGATEVVNNGDRRWERGNGGARQRRRRVRERFCGDYAVCALG